MTTPPGRWRRAALGVGGLLVVAPSVGWLGLSPESGPTGGERAPVAAASATVDGEACKALTSRLCEELGPGDACALARRETGHFTPDRCRSMLSRFPVVAKELADMAAGVRALTAPEQRLLHSEAPALGPPNAALTLVEFADFQSADCGRAAPMVALVNELFEGRVRFVFRQYPSPRHPDAHLAAEASLAALAQGKFWEYHDVLFANPQDLGRPALERYAAAVGLDMSVFRHALDARLYADDVDADVALGHSVQALARPSLYANGKPVSVPYGVAELTRVVETALAESR